MSRQRPEFYKKKLVEAMERNLCIVSAACKEVGISRDRYYHYLKTDDKFKEQIDELVNVQADFVESQFYKKIREGSERSIIFYLKTKGRERGWQETTDITSAGEKLGSDVKIIFVDGNKGNKGLEENDSNG